ncbi:MAG: AAA family ATPase, partial [Chitinivibrionia bacterium]|nr:AAA family ATPase [Chitinivibrionia bacterium]
MFIISMAAEKGGVGKSTISAMLSQVMGYANKRVLLLDLDQQADSSAFMALPKEQPKTTIVDLFAGRCSYENFVKNGAIRKSGNSQVDVITGSIHLIDLYGRLSANKTIEEIRKMVAENFRALLKELTISYDFVFVDFPPGIDTVWEPILQLSSQIIVPVTPHLMAMQSAVKSAIILTAHGIKPDKISIVPNQITASNSHKKDLELI